MNARLKRLIADNEKINNDFIGHPYIKFESAGGNPPERYLVTYKVKGYKLDDRGRPVIADLHQVEIYLHADYPKLKPYCFIKTPIFHPNFRDGKICIGDHWNAGESISDIVVHIGDMIQYRSFNPKSPLNAEAARWSLENRHLFPAGNIDLWLPEPEISIDGFETEAEPEAKAEMKAESEPKQEPVAEFEIELGEAEKEEDFSIDLS